MIPLAAMLGLVAVAGQAPTLPAEPFPLSAVRLLPGPFREAQDRDAAYLLLLNPDRLLAGFRTEAGLVPRAAAYGGWESGGIAGHTLGHYLSACSQIYAATGDPIWLPRIRYIVSELADCQAADGQGYVAAIPHGKQLFTDLGAGRIRVKAFSLNDVGVPWYTVHKLFAGLLDVHALANSDEALTVARGMADWILATFAELDDDSFQRMLGCEHGGMNESLAELFARTGDQRYLDLSRRFHHRAVLDPLAEGRDSLTGLHANTQIPKAVGVARRYQLTGDDPDRAIAEGFWDLVVDHYCYVNGGHSNHENFGLPDRQGTQMSAAMTETCNSYNMLKLTALVHAWRPTAAEADFYERTMLNHILTSQDPRTGLTAYKLGLYGGWFQSYCSVDDSFWCCTGTGMENHARYGAFVYSHGDDTLWVNLFVPTELSWPERGVRLRQETEFPETDRTTLIWTCDQPTRLQLRVRVPGWAVGGIRAAINGQAADAAPAGDGYATIDRVWRTGDRIEVRLPMALRVEPTPDVPSRVAICYGPVALAAALGTDGMPPQGPYGKPESGSWGPPPMDPPALVGADGPIDEWLRPVPAQPLTFRTVGVGRPSEQTLIPLCRTQQQRFTAYWDRLTNDQWQALETERQTERDRVARLEARTIDRVVIGVARSEQAHQLAGERTESGAFDGHHWRHATDGGWFEYTLRRPAEGGELVVRYWGSDQGRRTFDILANGQKLATETLALREPGQFVDVVYPLPAGADTVAVRFAAHPGNFAGGVFDVRVLRPEE